MQLKIGGEVIFKIATEDLRAPDPEYLIRGIKDDFVDKLVESFKV